MGYGEEYDQVDACQQLLRTNSKRRDLHVALSKALDKRHRYKQAVKAYNNALLIFPNDDYFVNKLSIAKSNLEEQQWLRNKKQNVKAEIKNATSPNPSVQFELNKIRCTRLTGEIALKACNQAIQQNDKDAILYISIGDIYASQRKNKQAIAYYQKAIKLEPKNKSISEKLKKSLPREKSIKQVRVKQDIAKQSESRTNNVAGSEKKASTELNPKQVEFLEQLNFLNSLKKQEIISQTEYQQRKKALLDATFRVSSVADKKFNGTQKSKILTKKADQTLNSLNFGNYYALIIGNNQYKHLPQLETAVNDAQSLAGLLKKHYGFKVKLLLNANRYNTLKAMGEFRNTLTKDDNLLIYYAGHGVLDKASERGYWLPVDAEQNFTSNWISTAEITDTLKALQSWHVLVVADSCYSGTLVRSATVTFIDPEKKYSLIKRLLNKKSRTVLTSGGLEPVTDSGGDNHSVFAEAFLDVLINTEDVIEAEQVFSRLRDKVVLNADQTPEYSNVRKVGHNGGDFIFFRQ